MQFPNCSDCSGKGVWVLNFEEAAYNHSEQGIQPQSAASLLLALYESLQGVAWGKARADLAKVTAKGLTDTTSVKVLDLPVEVVAHLNNVLEVCLFGVEGGELVAQIKENFELFTKEERAEKLRLSQSDLFGGGA